MLALLEEWNEQNPTDRLSTELQEMIEKFFHIAYVAGIDDLSEYILRIIELNKTKARNIPATLVRTSVIDYKPVR
jgi:hypothetical protein